MFKEIVKLRLLLFVCLYSSCVDNNKESIIGNTDSSIKNSSHDSVINYKSEKPCMKASAYLIYDDSTLSAFYFVNNYILILWN
jgi:hypothetical protein